MNTSDSAAALRQALDLVLAFTDGPPSQSALGLAQLTGTPLARIESLLDELVGLGIARRRDGGYALTPKVMRLGEAYLSSVQIPSVAKPHLEALTAETGESTSAAVLDDTDILYVLRVPIPSEVNTSIGVGTRFPAWASSLGRVLLAAMSPSELDAYFASVELTRLTARTRHTEAALRKEIAAVKSQGWSLVDRELSEDLTSMSAPVRDGKGEVVAAVNVSFTALDYGPAITDARAPLLACAAAIGADLARI